MRVAVVGCGSIGLRHLRNLKAAGVHDIIAFDPSPAARKAARALGARCEETSADVWRAEPEVAFITAGTSHHIPLAMDAAAAGCDLFVEKPLSHDRTRIDELVSLVRMNRLVTMVGCNMRFHPGPSAVKASLEAGEIGKPLSARLHCGSFLPSWRPHQDYRQSYSASPVEGGATLDAIHEIDLALWYFGAASLHASLVRKGASLELETDALAEILLQHESGVVSSVHLDFIERDYRRYCEIIGTTGTIEWRFRQGLKVHGEDGSISREAREPEGYDLNDMYEKELSHFLSCVQSRTTSMNPLDVAARTLDIALEARRGAAP